MYFLLKLNSGRVASRRVLRATNELIMRIRHIGRANTAGLRAQTVAEHLPAFMAHIIIMSTLMMGRSPSTLICLENAH